MSIYSKTSAVIAWVGAEAEESGVVLEVLSLVGYRSSLKKIEVKWRESGIDFQNALEAFCGGHTSLDRSRDVCTVRIDCLAWAKSCPLATISPALNIIDFDQKMSSIYFIRAFPEAF